MSALDDHVACSDCYDPFHQNEATMHVSPNLKVRNPQNKTQQRGSICMGHDVCANSRTVDWIPFPYK
ncbi:hypothetical protein ACFX13_042586 [Malus domestica]